MADSLLEELFSSVDKSPPPENRLSSFDKENKKLAPLLDEIEQIEDASVKSFVRAMLYMADLFWSIPSSFSGKYHPPDEHGYGGNVLHTKRVAKIAIMICESQQRLEYETDLCVAAALLHDVTKGVMYDGHITYDPMHPYTVDKFYEAVQQYDEENGHDTQRSSTLYLEPDAVASIMRMIHCSHGPWSPIPETFPVTSLEWNLHIADRVATEMHNVVDMSGRETTEEDATPGGPTNPTERVSISS